MSWLAIIIGIYIVIGIVIAETAMKGSIMLGHEDFGAWSYLAAVLFWPVILGE